MGITEFLRQRIFEDQAFARPAFEGSLVAGSDDPGYVRPYIQRFPPARMLDEAEAKRSIIGLHDRAHECSVFSHGDVDPGAWIDNGQVCSTLRLLAAVYKHHPDYDPAWAADG